MVTTRRVQSYRVDQLFFITTTPEIDQTGDSKQYISIL